ncbi:poly-gamma-glutamate synthesis protein (capsule biosynthesis protein) [Anaerosolibacter carboniphilus]|uniref:Poly-gamma-glutamate synthesis protein (Capsule biosynthesis protein) n=1 Tax=Anaerosolibacter carboniphilus TaxID=1417629 RepID=A0A841KTG8_9FIRM|nr:CapA family protein [Anaerosolibacter carboniphilus]MBB6216886.1 poly-gamma-glutamate synthesis protein (capsule biosynthesis protein) [Anaerosolibacter carboniphilus]
MFIQLTLSFLLMVSNLLYPQIFILNPVPIGNRGVEQIQKIENVQNIADDGYQGEKSRGEALLPATGFEEEKHTAEENISENRQGYDEVITISFAGDCTLGWDDTAGYFNSFPYRLEKENGDFAYFFKGVKQFFESDDLTLVNLETTLTTYNKKAEKKFRFKGEPSYVNILKEGSIEMVNLANNHIYDYLEQGFKETIGNLEKGEILYSGEGFMGETTIRDIKVVSLGYRGWDISIKEQLMKDIQRAKGLGDIVLVSFHWGEERRHFPNKTQRILAYTAIDEGADIVVGHHPHVIQGIEKYKDKYILYSLGNFSFGGNKNPMDKDSFIFQNRFYLKDKKIIKNEGVIVPCKISSVNDVNDYQPTVARGEEAKRIVDRLLLYSEKLLNGISGEEEVYIKDIIN